MNTQHWWFINVLFEPFPLSSSTHQFLFSKLFENCAVPTWVHLLRPLMYGLSGIATLLFVVPFFLGRLSLFLTTGSLSSVILFLLAAESCLPVLYVLLKCVSLPSWTLPIGIACNIVSLFVSTFLPAGVSVSSGVLSVTNGFIIGIAQALALLPGCSRFAFTFTAARWCGFAALDALYVSFGLIVPFFLAQAIYDLSVAPCLPSPSLKATMFCFALVALTYLGFKIVALLVFANKLFLFVPYLLILFAGVVTYLLRAGW